MTSATRKIEPEPGARERLLTAALTLFNEKGYAAASVREIVEAAGVTKPVLYYYFGNKEGIYLELMQNSYGTFESLAARSVSVEASAQERILQFCSDLFDASLERLPEVRLIYAIYFGPPQGAPQFDLEAYFIRMMELIHRLVSAGVASGELRENSVDGARAVIAILTSAINEQLSGRESKLDRDGMVRLLRLLMRGMAK
ncbi:MAG: TetR family transcriptional regulator [Geobacteraceae bacterium GWC2_58_44]|nr:MAG: TetR family transcriptional regulator [Geobacteraceae bacterium GWC2_58_44]HBG05562.1 TetR/AcrR family transcriptional regulator [Geobacter sp.]